MKKLSEIYESLQETEPLTVTKYSVSRDGGSQHLTFSDGFSCMFDHGIGSSTKFNFVKSWEDRTIIDLPQKYKNVLKNHKYFQNKEYL